MTIMAIQNISNRARFQKTLRSKELQKITKHTNSQHK